VSQPVSFTNFVGYTNSLSMVAAGASLTYQWYNGAAKVPGATNASLVLNNLQLTNDGASYSVVVSNTLGSITSVVATVGVLLCRPMCIRRPSSARSRTPIIP